MATKKSVVSSGYAAPSVEAILLNNDKYISLPDSTEKNSLVYARRKWFIDAVSAGKLPMLLKVLEKSVNALPAGNRPVVTVSAKTGERKDGKKNYRDEFKASLSAAFKAASKEFTVDTYNGKVLSWKLTTPAIDDEISKDFGELLHKFILRNRGIELSVKELAGIVASIDGVKVKRQQAAAKAAAEHNRKLFAEKVKSEVDLLTGYGIPIQTAVEKIAGKMGVDVSVVAAAM